MTQPIQHTDVMIMRAFRARLEFHLDRKHAPLEAKPDLDSALARLGLNGWDRADAIGACQRVAADLVSDRRAAFSKPDERSCAASPL